MVRYRLRLSGLVGWQRSAVPQWFFNSPTVRIFQTSYIQLPVTVVNFVES